MTDVDDGGEAEEVKGDLPILSFYVYRIIDHDGKTEKIRS